MDHTTIAGIRLANHQLSGSKFPAPQQLVSWMGAMQAQDFNMARWAVGIRIPGTTDRLVTDAFNRGDFLRTHVLRPTWHFVAPEDIRWMLQLTGPRIISSMRSRDRELGITDELRSKGLRIFEKSLEGNRHQTREELVTTLAANSITVDSMQMMHLTANAELIGLICSGAMKGKKQTYALLDERATQAKPINKDEALAKLALTYFTSHGPATLPDFVWWSGLSTTEARQGLELVKTELVAVNADGQDYWMAGPPEIIPAGSSLAHLLPAFDEYIISYKDRKAALPAEHHQKAVSTNGIFRPTVLVNGRVVGLWKKANPKDRTVAVDLFASVDKHTQALINKAEEGFKQFLK